MSGSSSGASCLSRATKECARVYLVGAVADKDLLRPDPVIGSECSPQRPRLRVRIEAQRLSSLGTDRVQNARGRAERALIRVQLDHVRHAGLLARQIGVQLVHQAAPEPAHWYCPMLMNSPPPSLTAPGVS